MQLVLDIFGDVLDIAPDPVKKLKPEEMSLLQFLELESWRAMPDERASGESKGNYILIQPNGEQYSGGWIGKHKNEEAAKRDFHKKQVYFAIHWGRVLPDHVLFDYPDLKSAQQSISQMKQNILLSSGPYVKVRVSGCERYFHMMDVPLYSRVDMREFVRIHRLCSDGARVTNTSGIDEIEQMAIALEYVMSRHMDEDHRPHLLIEEYEHSLRYGGKPVVVRLRVPIEVNGDGQAVSYEIYEGHPVYSLSSAYPAIQVDVGGESKRMPVLPSQFVGIKMDESSSWIDVTLGTP